MEVARVAAVMAAAMAEVAMEEVRVVEVMEVVPAVERAAVVRHAWGAARVAMVVVQEGETVEAATVVVRRRAWRRW